MSNKNKIQYRRVGDYLIPNLILPPEEAKVTLGKWGIMHKTYLEKHKQYVFFNTLLMQGKQLKEENQLEWVQRMNNIQQQAKEIVLDELIYK